MVTISLPHCVAVQNSYQVNSLCFTYYLYNCQAVNQGQANITDTSYTRMKQITIFTISRYPDNKNKTHSKLNKNKKIWSGDKFSQSHSKFKVMCHFLPLCRNHGSYMCKAIYWKVCWKHSHMHSVEFCKKDSYTWDKVGHFPTV